MTDDPEQLIRELEAMTDAEKLAHRPPWPPWPPGASVGVLTQERLLHAWLTTAEREAHDARVTAPLNALKTGDRHV